MNKFLKNFFSIIGYVFSSVYDFLFDCVSRLIFGLVYLVVKYDDSRVFDNQRNIFESLLKRIKDTEFGNDFDLDKIFQSEDLYLGFSSRLPIFEYKDFRYYIEKSKIGDNIIWPGKISKYSASSGTTGNKKHIPVTNESLLSTTKAGAYMFSEILHGYKGIHFLGGAFLPLVGSIHESCERYEIGDVSALILKSRKGLTSSRNSLGKSILLNPNWEEKRGIICEKLDVNRENTMVGVTSWAYEILNYIQKRDKERFKKLVENMELIIGGGVDVAPFMYYFKEHDIKYIGVYNASEGYFGYQDIVNYDNSDGNAPYKLMTNHGVFYEFLELNSDNFDLNGNVKVTAMAKPIWGLTENDIGKNFALVITTNGGLVRYLIGDVINFVDKNYRFKIVGRTRQSINLKGEELMETHVNAVIDRLFKEDEIKIKYYTIGPDSEDGPLKHEWIIELSGDIGISKEAFAMKIDRYLQEINPDYKAKRENDMLLMLPLIHIVQEGTFYNWLKSKNKLGAQSKVPKLSSNRLILEEIYKFM